MRNLLNFIARYSNLIVFLFLEAVSVWFLVNAGGYHASGFIGGVRDATLFINRKADGLREYVGLRDKNQRLARENLILLQKLESMNAIAGNYAATGTPLPESGYTYILSRVVSNSVNTRHNFFTLDKGRNDGIEPEMAVAGSDGVAGIVVSVSDNFSRVMSVLNLDFRLSARLKKNRYFGSLRWDGYSVRQAGLHEIPCHVDVAVGDTVETSGYSALFPPGILIGTVAEIDDSGGDFYRIVVNLSTDFRKLDYMYIIKNQRKHEQMNLEEIR